MIQKVRLESNTKHRCQRPLHADLLLHCFWFGKSGRGKMIKRIIDRKIFRFGFRVLSFI